jgi:chaperonin cofactor prefoldin
MVTPLTVTPQKTGKYFQDKRKIISPLVTPGTYLHNTMDKTDIVHALNQYVEKLNIVLKTLRKQQI